VELEHDDGLTIDSVLLVGHLAGRETGIEEIHFEDGVICDRTRMDAPTRTGRFNAQDDAVRFADKDAPFAIDAALLFENDSDLPPWRPSFITRICWFDIRRFRVAQARRVRRSQIAQVPGALARVSGCQEMNVA
jgi:hypothetical protein